MNCIRLIRSMQHETIFKICAARHISQHPLKFIETQDKLREKDGVSKQWQLIYKAPMQNILKFVSTYLTFSTTSVSCGLVYYSLFVFNINTMNEPVSLSDDIILANNAIECLIYLGAFIIFHAGVKILLSKFVIRLYQNEDNYLAIFQGHTYNSIKKHEFHLKEFKKLNPALVVSWSDARFGLGKKKGILLENYFKTPQSFNYLLYKRKKESNPEE